MARKEDWQRRGQGHRQRLRDRFLDQGIQAFSDEEIIEMLLAFGTPRSDTKPAARAALERFGSLPAVLDASRASLLQVDGIGPKNAFALHFVQGVARRYLRQRLEGRTYVHSSAEVAAYLRHLLAYAEREHFVVLYLDAGHAILDSEIVSSGTVDVSAVYPREVIKAAVARNAAALVLAHNHPSGRLHPSVQDIRLTRTICLAASVFQIRVLDHLIVGAAKRVYSFADHGDMERIERQVDEILRLVDRGDGR